MVWRCSSRVFESAWFYRVSGNRLLSLLRYAQWLIPQEFGCSSMSGGDGKKIYRQQELRKRKKDFLANLPKYRAASGAISERCPKQYGSV